MAVNNFDGEKCKLLLTNDVIRLVIYCVSKTNETKSNRLNFFYFQFWDQLSFHRNRKCTLQRKIVIARINDKFMSVRKSFQNSFRPYLYNRRSWLRPNLSVWLAEINWDVWEKREELCEQQVWVIIGLHACRRKSRMVDW